MAEKIRGNLVTTIPPTIVTINKIKLVTIVERGDILSVSAETRKAKEG
jgi:hypothetical protein